MSGTTINVNLPAASAPSPSPDAPPPAPEDGRAVAQRLGRPVRALANDGRKHGIRSEIPNVGGDTSTAVIRLYDVIDDWGGFWGVSALEFAEVLDGLPDSVTTIQLLVNSPGGFVYEGIAIMNMLRNHPARVHVVVEGIAASAASFIACGQDELTMSANSELMVHDPSGICFGGSEDMRKYADRLDAVADNIASIYQSKAGGDLADWRAIMAAETWFSAEEAAEIGLADNVTGPPSDDGGSQPSNRFDLSIFNFAGRANAPEPQDPADHPAGGSTPTPAEGGSAVAFSDEQLTDLRQKLDVDADADEATILDAVDVLLEQATAPSDPNPIPNTDPIPDGHVAVPEARLRDLETAANAGAGAAQKLRDRERDEFLDSVRSKYVPANRDAWAKEYDRDPEGTRKHFENAPDILPVDQIGNGGNVDLDADDAFYAQLYGPEKEVAR